LPFPEKKEKQQRKKTDVTKTTQRKNTPGSPFLVPYSAVSWRTPGIQVQGRGENEWRTNRRGDIWA